VTQGTRTPPHLRILVVGNSSVLRAGIVQYVQLIRVASQVGEADFRAGLPAVVSGSVWDLIALDLQEGDNLSILQQIQQASPTTPILVLNGVGATPNSQAAFAAGASGYLNKNSGAQEWRNALVSVAAGKRYPSDDAPDGHGPAGS
jgi:DNA-binding NarL/FixJ family response regulator